MFQSGEESLDPRASIALEVLQETTVEIDMEIHDVVEVEVDIVLVVETKIVQVEETRTAVSFLNFLMKYIIHFLNLHLVKFMPYIPLF